MTEQLFSDRIALVTGASRGIGAATALELGKRGAHVLLVARTAGALEEVEERIHDAGGSATIAPLDLADGDSVARLAGAVQERWGKLDMLVLNAAMLGQLSAVPSIDMKEMAKLMTLNVSAQAALIASFDPMLRKSGRGRVIGITSSVGRKPRPYWGLYGASKAAFDTLLASYAEEQRTPDRIRVAIVDPGATRTKMRERAYPGEDPQSVKPPEMVAERIAALLAEDFQTGHFERVE